MKLTVLGVLVLVLMTGCVTNSTGGIEVSLKEGGGQASIRIDDSSFKRHVDVEETLLRRATTGYIEARVRVRNREKRDFVMQYKFMWFDSDGMEIQPGSRPWGQTTLHGGEAVTLSATAPEKSGTGFVVRLRRIQ